MKLHQKPLSLAALSLVFCLNLAYADSPNAEARINELIAKMTLPEKVAMCVGGGPSEFQGVPIPNMKGPRGPHGGDTTAFPCGFGLSYTTLKFENLELSQTNGEVTARVSVRNAGERAGAETVQLYVHELQPPIERPVHELKAFQKINLMPGETKTVTLELNPGAFSYYSLEHHKWELPSDDFEIQVGDSSRDILLTGQIKVAGSPSDKK